MTVAAGATTKPVVKLTKAGKTLLAKDKTLKTKVTVSSKTATGTTATTTRSVTVTAAKPVKKHKK